MRPFIVGIGGCGGKLAEKFLKNQDVTILGASLGDNTTFGSITGMWLESDASETVSQNFFRPLSTSNNSFRPYYYIPHSVIGSDSKTSRIVNEKYGYDSLKQGFFRQAEYLKALFEIYEIDKDVRKAALEEYQFENPILRATWNKIRPYTTLAKTKINGNGSDLSDGILFIVSLGGGTGTGFINPITKYIREERSAFPVFVLGVITEEGEDRQQHARESKRNLSAIISMNDLLTKKREIGVDGLILVDNQLLVEKFGRDYSTINQFIYQSFKPLLAPRHYPGENPPSLAIRQHFLEMLDMPPILIPCYYRSGSKSSEQYLVKKALDEGKLFGCNPKKADNAIVFARGFIDSNRIIKALSDQIGLSKNRISIWRKLGDNLSNEITILLRNPYGEAGAYNIKGSLENRIYRMTGMALGYIDEFRDEILEVGWPDVTNEALENYFFGETGLRTKLRNVMVRVEQGKRPIFLDELKIFGALEPRDHAPKAVELLESPANEEQIRSIVDRILNEKGLIKSIND
jgi:hypothetical protein